MPAAVIGFDTAWGLGTEPTYGTAVAPADWVPFTSESLAKEREALELVTSQGRYQMELIGDTGRHLGRQTVSGDINFPVEPVNIGYVLKHGVGAAGTPTTVVAGTYDHVFAPLGTLNSFTAHVPLKNGTANKRVVGGMIDTFSLDYAEDFLSSSAGVKAKDYTIVTSSPPTPTYPTQRPYTFRDVSMIVGGVTGVEAHVRSGSLQVSNQLIDDDYRQGAVTPVQIYPGALTVEGSFEVVYDPTLTSGNFYDWMEQVSAQNVTVDYKGNTFNTSYQYWLRALVPRAIVTSATPEVSAGEKVMRTVNFRAFYDPTQTNGSSTGNTSTLSRIANQDKALSFTLRNARSAAY